MKNWKTFSAGVAMILGGVVTLYFAYQENKIDETSLTTAIGTILGGIGLMLAKDSDVTGAGKTAKRVK